MLAQEARSVIGIDVYVEAINHAIATHGEGTLRFLPGYAGRILLEYASVDVVVSFETIEYLLPDAGMIIELRRVLKPGGFLIISSPNRDICSDKIERANPFTLKDVKFSEFGELLKEPRLFHRPVSVGEPFY
jgi:2-polyprenyl-3-methyl-5-hydroxy-6-metoxy-1,4-benzoquinol methylase